MIADKSAIVVNTVFDSPEKYAGCYVLVAGILYSIELYADFLSCVTISQGVAKLFGIDLVNNFMQPYFSTSTKEFWRRWHISFSEWLRDYVYIPLGGSRKGKIPQYSNLILTFAVSGVWHGSGYKYLFWGLLHAAYQIVGNVTFGVKEKIYDFLKLSKQSGTRKMLQRMGCFFWVMLAWIIFRANNLKTGLQMIKSMFVIHNPWIFFNDELFSLGLEWKEWRVLLISIIILIYVSSRQESGLYLSEIILSRSIYVRWLLYVSIILSIMVFGTYGYGFDVHDFIYGGF
ncbi:MBOAT family O-acyltransferase [Petralouisia muris]|uniref:MBOAT family O-acyltransferase n=1 Tax=Petralouisia muris TaxID=3032872 RepID=UPI001441A19E|nr:MBOAT family O-acyltransferase [Petralouisia muris]